MSKKVNFSTRITEEQKTFLNEIAWIKGVSVSEYVINLINEDMKKYPNWKDNIDELNGLKEKMSEVIDKEVIDKLDAEESTDEPEDDNEELLNKLLSTDVMEYNSDDHIPLPEDIKQEMGKQLIEINKLLKGK